MKLLILFALVFSVQAKADDPIAVFMAQNPTASPYDVIKSHFDHSRAAKISDFPPATDKAIHLDCRSVVESDPTKLYTNGFVPVAYTFNKTVTPGTPDDGPLFPGTPATLVAQTVILFVDFLPQDFSSASTDVTNDNMQLTTTPQSLVQTQAKADQNGYQEFRVSAEGFILLREISKSLSDPSKNYTGMTYCWKK